jgi:hypothetical protein
MIRKQYGQDMQIFYTSPNGDILAHIVNQDNLDSAVKLIDQSERLTSLRVLLSLNPHASTGQLPGSLANIFKQPEKDSGRDSPPPGRDSPPPGTLPRRDRHMERSNSKVSCGSEGEFIPEDRELGSLSSVTSDYGSQNRYRGSQRSVFSSPEIESYPGDCVDDRRGGTYPRTKPPMSSQSTFASPAAGPNSYPRRGRNSGLEFNSNISSQYTRLGSDQSIATSSSSSGVDMGEFREFRDSRRQVDVLANRLKQLNPNKSPKAPKQWRKGRLLGQGAFGQVYLCMDLETGMEMAVKQVQLTGSNSETSKEVKALQCEISLLKNLSHAHIVQYYGSQEEPGTVLSIFMEYMPGGSVKDQLLQYGALPENVVRNYTRQVLDGLHYLHGLMIVHRDIKGANVLRDHSMTVKLGDFGASKRLQAIRTVTQVARTVTGTPYWMSPEVINGDGYGRRADIWSVGSTVVEMLTTHPPWHEFEAMAAIFKIATTDYPKYQLPDSASETAHDFLSLCFRKSSDERPTAAKLLNHPFVTTEVVYS